MPKRQPHPTLKVLGRRIRALRKRQKWSQERLADEAAIDRSYMSGIERGIRNISVLNLIKIAQALREPVTGLFERD